MCYLGAQGQVLSREGLEWLIRADVRTYRMIDAANVPLLWELKAALPKCTIGFRLVRNIDLSDPAKAARDFWNALAPKLAEFPFDFCSGANETGYHSDDSVAYSEFNRLLAAFVHDKFPRMLYGSFDWGVCWPDVALVRDGDYDAGLVDGDFLAMHLYHLPDNEDANTIYHHRHVRAALPKGLVDKPIWATEFGLDYQGRAGDGWSGPTWGWTPERYAEWIEATAATLTDVEHGIVFLSEETDPTWASWRVVGHNVIADAVARANKAEDKRREQTMLELHGRAAAMAAAIGDTSKVLTGPVYMTPDTFYQRTERYTYTWTRGDDTGIAAENRYSMGADGVLVEIPNLPHPII